MKSLRKGPKMKTLQGLILASLKGEEISCLFSLTLQMCQRPISAIVSNAVILSNIFKTRSVEEKDIMMS